MAAKWVAVYSSPDGDSYSEVDGFAPFKVKVEKTSNIIGAPVETGQISFDNKVKMPKKITVEGQIDFDWNSDEENDANEILTQMWENRKFEFYCVVTKEKAYKNLVLKDMISENDTEKFDLTKCTLVFLEVLLVQSNKSKTPINSDNAPVLNKGVVVGE